MRYFNLIDIDLKLVSQLKAPFKGSEQPTRVPMLEFKETMRNVFKHFRQMDEISAKVTECVVVLDSENKVSRSADLTKLTQLIDFMRCFPILVKRDKNSSQGMNYVMDGNSFKGQQVTAREAEDVEVSARVGMAEL